MKRVCAWCGRGLDQTDVKGGARVTHGVCRRCRGIVFPLSQKKHRAVEATTTDGQGNEVSKTSVPAELQTEELP